jgi:hypothetical protein
VLSVLGRDVQTAAASPPGPPPPIGVGEQTLRVNVTMSWEIKP